MNINSPITDIKGVGEKTKDSFAKLGVYTVGDILLHFPRNYILFPKIKDINEYDHFEEGHMYAIHAIITSSAVVKKTRSMPITVLNIGDMGHKIQLVWFRAPYIKNELVVGKHFVFYGKIKVNAGKYTMEHPEIYTPEKYSLIEETLQPIYPLTAKVSNNLVTKTIKEALNDDGLFADHLPADIKRINSLCDYNYAVKQIHFPDDMDSLITARKRLVFDEFFLFIMGMQYQKEKQIKEHNCFNFISEDEIYKLINKLQFPLTNAQKKTITEIIADMKSDYAMQRLIQGDVGSGKTIVAFLTMAWVSLSGYQSAIMAPTEVLAKQHYESFVNQCQYFGLDIPVILLTGSMTAKQKKEAYAKMQEYSNAMVIGTHALIQEKAIYDNLALVITDEQHRFGVKQRDAFSEKGEKRPHILVMSATPIPRTLAIIIYGDMDISVINEVPARRKPIKNCVVNQGYRPKAYDFIKEQLDKGHQAYIICPLVEASENSEGENVADYSEYIKEYYGDKVKIGTLNGKMKSDAKNKVMEQFSNNEIQVLVSTTVVEVGVNVPNATVMMIENANKFGLAQLHQLRGRVGRGDAQSFCIMINSSNCKESKKRLEILNNSNDGFYIASEDLKLRGPGDFFGIRQSGDLTFELADIYQDADVLQAASEAVKNILDDDPELIKPEHKALQIQMNKFMDEQIKRMNL